MLRAWLEEGGGGERREEKPSLVCTIGPETEMEMAATLYLQLVVPEKERERRKKHFRKEDILSFSSSFPTHKKKET